MEHATRIAINAWFIDQPTTGSGQYLIHLLSEYAAGYCRHRYLLCTHPHHPVPEALQRLSQAFEWQELSTPLDRVHRHLAKVWFEQLAFPRACQQWGADVVHVPYWASPFTSTVPTVVTVHDLIPLLLPAYSGGALGRWYTRLVAHAARQAQQVLADSEASRRDIIQHLRIPPQRVRTVLLAADDRFCPVDDPHELDRVRQKYELPAPYLLYLGGFDVRKNVPGLLRAFARLDVRDVKMVIAGKLPDQDTDFFPDPRRVACELDILERVRFTGWVDEQDKPALYSGATAFVFPSYYEGFGLPPLEAMSCGTPVVVSNRGSLPELVGDAGQCVDPDDDETLAAAMGRIVRDFSLYEKQCRVALERSRLFGWRRCARETMMAYDAAAS